MALVDSLILNKSEPEDAGEALGELIRDYQADRTLPAPTFEGKDFTFYVDAIDAVEAQVPEPGSATLLACLGLVYVVFRRRS